MRWFQLIARWGEPAREPTIPGEGGAVHLTLVLLRNRNLPHSIFGSGAAPHPVFVPAAPGSACFMALTCPWDDFRGAPSRKNGTLPSQPWRDGGPDIPSSQKKLRPKAHRSGTSITLSSIRSLSESKARNNSSSAPPV
jgi:hypothetical protein